MEAKLLSILKENELITSAERLLLAVSAGIDSVVMAWLCKKCNLDFGIAHCNFQLRGTDSTLDAKFVKSLAEKLEVPYFEISFNTIDYAESNNLSIQMAARDLRYEWFEKIRKENQFHKIAVAHHLNDNTETFLINTIRGTGIAGLHGIAMKNNNLIRPMLTFSRAEIEEYALQHQIEWREDLSNQNDYYLRNNLRLNLIPELKKINPEFDKHIARLTWELNQVEQLKNKWLKRKKTEWLVPIPNGYRISIDIIKSYSQGVYFLQQLLKEYGFSYTVIEDIIQSMDGQSGQQFYASNYRLIKDRSYFILSQTTITENECYVINSNSTELLQSNLKIKVSQPSSFNNIEKLSKKEALLDKDKLQFPLIIRKWQEGDKFQPLGMKGHKKLSDYFIDEKFTLLQKENTFVLLSDNQIVWVIGHRIDERYKVTEQTKNLYQLSSYE